MAILLDVGALPISLLSSGSTQTLDTCQHDPSNFRLSFVDRVTVLAKRFRIFLAMYVTRRNSRTHSGNGDHVSTRILRVLASPLRHAA